MADWKDKIKAAFDEQASRRAEIHFTLSGLLQELSSVGLRGKADLISEDPLSWKITIDTKSVELSEEDIRTEQTIYSDYGLPLPELKDLKETLQKILENMFSKK